MASGVTDHTDIVVAGAGVVGLAIARALAAAGREVVVLEKAGSFGTQTSSRNSEVIHAGLYYPSGSLKARLCVEGRDKLYRYCASRGVAHRRCGKLIVAVDRDQIPALEALARQAAENGVADIEPLSGSCVRHLEPELKAAAGLYSPATGIIDSHGLMLSLLGEAEAGGAVIAYNTEITEARLAGKGVEILVNGETRPALTAALLINAAGLQAPALAGRIRGFPAEHVPQSWLARGCYFSMTGRTPFRRLIYPLPEPGGLGIHLTLDLAGQARFGPDVEWIDAIDYRVDPARAQAFAASIRRYWPALDPSRLSPSYAGIRPKLSGPGLSSADFRIDGPADHGGLPIIHLYGIESPGLTASLAIADHVVALLD
jgi:L-2-hydroxyglutarate oxidase LhgO